MISLKGRPDPLFSYELVNEDFIALAKQDLGEEWNLSVGSVVSGDVAELVAGYHPGEQAGDLVSTSFKASEVVSQLTRPTRNNEYEHLRRIPVATLLGPTDFFEIIENLARFGTERSHVSRTNKGIRVTQAGGHRARPETYDLRAPDALALKEWLLVQHTQLGADVDRDVDDDAFLAHGISFRDLDQIRKLISAAGFGDPPDWITRMRELFDEVQSKADLR